MKEEIEKIKIKKMVGDNLAFRSSANDIFNYIENNFKKKVYLDFKGVISISNAFARQYELRKLFSIVPVKEINTNKNIKKMFISAKKGLPSRKEMAFPKIS
ncbi:MAG: hypothetical protein QXL94_02465 [Candidatus Parvarchaeum sp.]